MLRFVVAVIAGDDANAVGAVGEVGDVDGVVFRNTTLIIVLRFCGDFGGPVLFIVAVAFAVWSGIAVIGLHKLAVYR